MGPRVNEAAPASRSLLLLALLAIAVYANALRADFTFDDEPDIVTNPVVTGPFDLVGIFATPLPPGDIYRPVAVLSYALNHHLTPSDPFAFHAVNLALHAAVTVLVFLLARALFASARIAVIGAALFAVHPVHTEAVTNLVGRAELLAALFGLLSLLSAVHIDGAGTRIRSTLAHAGSVFCFSLALLSKESALTVLPLIVLLRVTVRHDGLLRGGWRELHSLVWVPYALCAAVILVLRWYVVSPRTVNALDNVLAFVPWPVRVRSAVAVLWDYFGILNVPLVLGADYSYAQVPPVGTWLNGRFLGGAGLLLAAAAVAVRNRRPAVTFVVIFPLVALSLTANILFPIGTVKGDRLLYLPSVGWVLLVAYAFDRLLEIKRYRKVARVVLAGVVTAYAARAWTRNWDWKDNPTLYRSLVLSAPNSAKARYDYGVSLQGAGQDAAAAVQFQRAFEIFPYAGGAGSPVALGVLAEKRGDTAAALGWYHKALELEPGFDKANNNLCRLLLILGRFEESARACREGLRYKPTDTNMMKALGESLIAMRQTAKGIAVLQRALALSPEDDALRQRLAELSGELHPEATDGR
ncbi:MAG: tetratricopeptide repeat protein [Candidatus Binatia bacterium]|jgi:protein O-mannosyl-transferase